MAGRRRSLAACKVNHASFLYQANFPASVEALLFFGSKFPADDGRPMMVGCQIKSGLSGSGLLATEIEGERLTLAVIVFDHNLKRLPFVSNRQRTIPPRQCFNFIFGRCQWNLMARMRVMSTVAAAESSLTSEPRCR